MNLKKVTGDLQLLYWNVTLQDVTKGKVEKDSQLVIFYRNCQKTSCLRFAIKLSRILQCTHIRLEQGEEGHGQAGHANTANGHSETGIARRRTASGRSGSGRAARAGAGSAGASGSLSS